MTLTPHLSRDLAYGLSNSYHNPWQLLVLFLYLLGSEFSVSPVEENHQEGGGPIRSQPAHCHGWAHRPRSISQQVCSTSFLVNEYRRQRNISVGIAKLALKKKWKSTRECLEGSIKAWHYPVWSRNPLLTSHIPLAIPYYSTPFIALLLFWSWFTIFLFSHYPLTTASALKHLTQTPLLHVTNDLHIAKFAWLVSGPSEWT